MTQTNRRWTWMVYMAGDNGKVFEQLQGGKQLIAPMEEQGYQDIREMEAVGSTDEVAILVQFDTLSDRDHTYRIYIRPQGEQRVVENISEQNMGDPGSLRDFIVWGIENYPAQYYAVILWNHGTGWKEDDIYAFARNRGFRLGASDDEVRSLSRNTQLSSAFFLSSILEVMQLEDGESRAIAFDDSSLDFLDNTKLQQAFRQAEEQTGQKVSLIGMDACLMSMVEVAYQLRANANYMVGSQEVEPLSGWPYTAILGGLTSDAGITPEALATLIVQEYGRYYEEDSRGSLPQITQSATNLMVVEKLVEAVGRLASVLRQLLAEKDFYLEKALSYAKRQVVRFKDKDCVDLYDFMKLIRDEYVGDSTELTTVLDEVMDLITPEMEPRLVVANVTSGLRFSRVKGLSIYAPYKRYSPFYDRSDFASCGWGKLVRGW
ncbi:MAG: clostripain-related cysteine peptidase [Coleofasciculus sp. D1-CHI-01]|uniref:clostripain-related cysteine peptidase n=1 Tax=Coleofasciculus sp. D1-CHI-01 TaxID=3068482 RepID=UPI00330515C3